MRNERSSTRTASIASRVLDGKSYSHADVLSLAGSVLTQALDRASRKRRVRKYTKRAKKTGK